MIKLENILISSYDIESLTVSWDIVTTIETVADYVIDIMRNDDPVYHTSGLVWTVSGLEAEIYTSYTDYTISGLDITDQWSYRNYYLQVRDESTAEISNIYGPYKIETERDLIAKEIIRRHALTLRSVYGGKPLLALKRKTNGQNCTDCYDEILGRRTEEHCLTCFDTAWVDGYWLPIEIQGMVNAAPRKNEITVWGNWEDTDVILTLANYPLLSPKDVIVDKLNRRWNIVQVRTVEKGLYIISQQAQLRLINKSDVIYNFDVTSSWS